MKCEKVTIQHFMDAWFSFEYDNLSKDDFEIVYSEYIDISGMFQTKEFELFSYINHLKNRVSTIKILVETQKQLIEAFNEPYVEGLKMFKKYGYKPYWDGDQKKFLNYLDTIVSKEKKYEQELKRKEYEFAKMRESKNKTSETTQVQTRHDFIKMLNSFNKAGYNIDRQKTTVEELALMIKQLQEDATKSAIDRV